MMRRYLKHIVSAVFFFLVAVQSNKPFVLDAIDFPLVARATSLTWRPVYYRGEMAPEHIGLYHPTFYINSLALFMKAFGQSEIAVRMFGVACALVSAYLLVLIFRQVVGRSGYGELLLLSIFLLNPYTIANVMVPDIDTTVLPVALLLFVHLCIRYVHEERDTGRRAWVVLSVIFALALWTKLTTPLVLPVFLFGVLMIAGSGVRKAAAFASKTAAFGTAVFLATYYAYCRLLRLPFEYTFTFLVASFTKGTSTGSSKLHAMFGNIVNGGRLAYWFTLPMAFVFILALVWILFDNRKDEKARLIRWVATLAFFVTVFYIALIAPFGGFFKYPFPVFGLMVLVVVAFILRRTGDSPPDYRITVAFFTAGFLLDSMLFRDGMFKNGAGAFVGSRDLKFIAIVVLLGGLAAVFMRRERGGRIASLAVTCVVVFGIGFQTSIARVQAIAPYSTTYEYGQTGLEDTAAYLKARTGPEEAVWAMKDVGHYSGRRYYENYAYFFDPGLESDLIRMLRTGKVRYYVATVGIGQDRIDAYPRIRRILEADAAKVETFGNYVIYRSRSSVTTSGP
jgi:hypothetical protein